MENIKACSLNNYLQRDGFVMCSNLLFSHQQELGINNNELLFLIKVMRHSKNFKLHDEVLDPTVSTRTLQRLRKSLKEKNLIDFKVMSTRGKDNNFITAGICYDLSNLEKRLQEISDKIAEGKNKEAEENASQYIIEFGEKSPMVKYLKKWEEHYGDKYYLSNKEKEWYNSLSEKEQGYIGRIFEWCEFDRMFKTITPRLKLFMTTKYRFDQLKSYCEEMFADEVIYNDEDIINDFINKVN